MKKKYISAIGVMTLTVALSLAACDKKQEETKSTPIGTDEVTVTVAVEDNSQEELKSEQEKMIQPTDVEGGSLEQMGYQNVSRVKLDQRMQHILDHDDSRFEYTVSEKDYYDEKGTFLAKCKLGLVQLKNESNDPKIEEMNLRIKDTLLQTYENNCEAVVIRARALNKDTADDVWKGLYYEESFNVFDVGEKMIQISNVMFTYAGEDYNDTKIKIERFDGEEGKYINSSDLWQQDYYNTYATIFQETFIKLEEAGNDMGLLVEDYKEKADKAFALCDYYYSQDGIVVICKPGYITPLEDGIPTYVIPYSELLPRLNKDLIEESFIQG